MNKRVQTEKIRPRSASQINLFVAKTRWAVAPKENFAKSLFALVADSAVLSDLETL